MESLLLFIFIFISFGNIVHFTETRSIFDPITNMFNPVHDDKVISSFLSPFHENLDDQGPEFHHIKERGHKHSKAWWDHTTGKPIIQNIFNDSPTLIPENNEIKSQYNSKSTELMDKVNALKDQDISNENKLVDGTEIQLPPNVIDNIKPNNNRNVEQIKGEVNSQEIKNEETTPDGKKILIALTKRHFYFQAQPVRPKEKNDNRNETVYYVDY